MALRDPVAVYNAATNVEAQLLCNIMNDAGVEAFITEDASPAGVWMFGTLPEIHKPQVWVDRSNLDRARVMLDDYERRLLEGRRVDIDNVAPGDAVSDVTFACEECGKSITLPGERRGHVETCPHCGYYVDVPEGGEGSPAGKPKTAESQTAPEPVKDEQPTGWDSLSRTTFQLWIEVFAVLSLAFIPDLSGALNSKWYPRTYSFFERELFLIIRSFQVSMPLLVILALAKEPWSRFGIVRVKWVTDALLGCAIWLVGNVAYYFVMSLLPVSMWEESASLQVADRVTAAGMTALCLFLVACVASSFAEEFAMRGYLLPRLERLLRSTWAALLITTALFASYHLYQGTIGVIGATVTGLVYGVSFVIFRRLWPLCLAHAIANFSAYVQTWHY